MPIYEYKCNKCETEFEVLVKMEEEVSCPVCEDKSLTKKFSTFGISSGTTSPVCASGCSDGFNNGRCGSGMCGCG